jgi:hypothetical protein
MGIQTTITITCDNKDCKGMQGKPVVIQWDKELVESGKVPAPDGYQYLIPLVFKQIGFWFCGQLCAAKFFLPPGYDVKQKAVVPINPNAEPAIIEETKVNWKDLPRRSEVDRPVNGQTQADGYVPEDGEEA